MTRGRRLIHSYPPSHATESGAPQRGHPNTSLAKPSRPKDETERWRGTSTRTHRKAGSTDQSRTSDDGGPPHQTHLQRAEQRQMKHDGDSHKSQTGTGPPLAAPPTAADHLPPGVRVAKSSSRTCDLTGLSPPAHPVSPKGESGATQESVAPGTTGCRGPGLQQRETKEVGHAYTADNQRHPER